MTEEDRIGIAVFVLVVLWGVFVMGRLWRDTVHQPKSTSSRPRSQSSLKGQTARLVLGDLELDCDGWKIEFAAHENVGLDVHSDMIPPKPKGLSILIHLTDAQRAKLCEAVAESYRGYVG